MHDADHEWLFARLAAPKPATPPPEGAPLISLDAFAASAPPGGWTRIGIEQEFRKQAWRRWAGFSALSPVRREFAEFQAARLDPPISAFDACESAARRHWFEEIVLLDLAARASLPAPRALDRAWFQGDRLLYAVSFAARGACPVEALPIAVHWRWENETGKSQPKRDWRATDRVLEALSSKGLAA